MDPITLFAMLKVSAEQPHPLEVRTFRDMSTSHSPRWQEVDPPPKGIMVR